uniref:Nonaspanin n=1 Tax=Tanacetum cinerariifolium TaxID=118510 RepID=A0A6L2K3D0_TANCI|nr:nonaspanin [Tanacetum cinerariifolium]
MQSGLAAGIDHRKEGINLKDVASYNPDAEADFNSALQELPRVDFPLLAELKSHKDANVKDIMNLLRLEGPLADAPRMSDFQPDVEQLRVLIHSLMGEDGTYGGVPAAAVTTTALSTNFASASSVPPISTYDYEIVDVDGQEGAGVDGQGDAQGNDTSFFTVEFEKEELDTTLTRDPPS